MVLARVEQDVDTAEQEVAAEAAAACGATSALRRLVFARSEEHVSHLEDALTDETRATPRPFRELARRPARGGTIDEALLVAAGGTCSASTRCAKRSPKPCISITSSRTARPQRAIDAVFRELAWQRSQLRALASNE